MTHDKDTIDYFDLVVLVAQKVMQERPEHLSERAYLRQRIARAWQQVDSYLSTPLGQLALEGNEGAQRRMRSLLGDLGREALIGAWVIGHGAGDMTEDPAEVANVLTADVARNKVRL